MTIAMRHTGVLPIPARVAPRQVARIGIFDSLGDAEPHWRALEDDGALMTPYQRFDFLSLWQRHIGTANGIEPFVTAAFDGAGRPLAVLPLGTRRIGALRVAQFLGDEHINFNMGIWRRDFAASATTADLDAILAHLSAHADALALVHQPMTWDGMRNPLSLLPHQPSPSFSHSGTLGPDFDTVLASRASASARKKLRKKADVLASCGPVRFMRAQNADEVRRALETFYTQKGARLRAQGIPSVFDEQPVRDFLFAASTIAAPAAIELFVLWVGDDVAAVMGGLAGDGRFCAMFNSINPDRFTTASPGDQMLIALARHYCERGFHTFDLGVGEARYKELVCNDLDPLFDSFTGLSPAGRLIAATARIGAKTKRAIKQNPTLWSLVNTARRLRSRF